MSLRPFDPSLKALLADLSDCYELDKHTSGLARAVSEAYLRLRKRLSPGTPLGQQLQDAQVVMVNLSLRLTQQLPRLAERTKHRQPRSLLANLYQRNILPDDFHTADQLLHEYLNAFPLGDTAGTHFLNYLEQYAGLVIRQLDADRLFPAGTNPKGGLALYAGAPFDDHLEWLSQQQLREGGVGFTLMSKIDFDPATDLIYGHVSLLVGYQSRLAGDVWLKAPFGHAQVATAFALATRLAYEVRNHFAPDLAVLLRIVRIHEIIRSHWPPDVDYYAPDAQRVTRENRPGRPRERIPIPRPENGLARSLIRIAYEKLQREGRWSSIDDLTRLGERRSVSGWDLHRGKVSRILNGAEPPPYEAVPFFADILNIYPPDLITAWHLEMLKGENMTVLRTQRWEYNGTALNPPPSRE